MPVSEMGAEDCFPPHYKMSIHDAVKEAEWFAGKNKSVVLARLVLEPLMAVAADMAFRRAGISIWACNLINAIVMVVSFVAIHASRRYFDIPLSGAFVPGI
jgi:hypothetical protein